MKPQDKRRTQYQNGHGTHTHARTNMADMNEHRCQKLRMQIILNLSRAVRMNFTGLDKQNKTDLNIIEI